MNHRFQVNQDEDTLDDTMHGMNSMFRNSSVPSLDVTNGMIMKMTIWL